MQTGHSSNNSAHSSSNAYGQAGKGYGSSAYAKDSMRGGRDFITPDKDPHHHWRDAYGNEKDGGSNSWIRNAVMHWPIQMIESQMQYVFASKADAIGETSALLTDVEFRWMGIKNISTIIISLLSLIVGIFLFVLIVYTNKNLIFAYSVMFIFLSHSFFPGYIIQRIKKFVSGEAKTKKFAQIIRNSWYGYEVSYIMIVASLYWAKDNINWVLLNEKILNFIESKRALKKIFYNFFEKIPFDKTDFIIEHIVNALIIGFIFYILAMWASGRKAGVEANKMKEAIDKEHLRPAQIIKNKTKRRQG